MMADRRDRSADDVVEEAIALRDRGRERAAIGLLERIVAEAPNSSFAWLIMGGLLWDRGDPDRALESFERAVEISPDLEKASLGVFHTALELGDDEKAFGEMKRFLSVSESEEYRNLIRGLKDIGRRGPS